MTAVLNVILLTLAGLSLLAALYFVLKGFGARSMAQRQAYNVGQVEAKRASQVNWVRAGFLFLVGLIFLGVFAVRPLISRSFAVPEPTQVVPTADLSATVDVATVAVPVVEPTVAASPTSPPATPSPEATAAPTATTAPTTAVVSSGVGVWLRGSPSTSGEQLEWLLDGTTVTLLDGQETADDLVWQQVRTDVGVEGWVARDFLTITEE